MFCPSCGEGQPSTHRFCSSCGAPLPRTALPRTAPKVARWFLGVPVSPEDPPHGALRVTRYLEEVELRSGAGSVRVPSHHVRFSVWDGDRALAAVSISDEEADELAEFLQARIPTAPAAGTAG